MQKHLILFVLFLFFVSCELEKMNVLTHTVPDDTVSNQDDFITDEDSITIPDEESYKKVLEFESGFVEIEAVSYKLDGRSLKSGKVRMWYNFQPADNSPDEKPLFVFFNGGPGAATALLFSYNTAKMTADQKYSEIDVTENKFNWNQIGNLLYIDARQTGFSYGITDDPSSSKERDAYFKTNNFNVFIDAADFIRTILRFLKTHPDIISNKIILVGESYGGTRATAMLNILLNVRDYSDMKRTYYDETLFSEIDEHFAKIHPEMSALLHKDIIKNQFAGQILIQPLVTGETQFTESGKLLELPESPLYEVEKETGVEFTPCAFASCNPHNNALQYLGKAGRDMYAYRKPYNWLFDYTDIGSQKMVQLELFEKLIKNNPRKIDLLYSKNRKKGFRYPGEFFLRNTNFAELFIPDSIKTEIRYRINGISPLAVGNFDQTFGTLESWDQYFVDLNRNVTQLFYYATTTPYSKINGEMFIQNIRDLKTFITQAEEDIIIYAPGIPASLKKFNEIKEVSVSEDEITVYFNDDVNVVVSFPFYPGSSHSVSVNQPEKFFNDVQKWINF